MIKVSAVTPEQVDTCWEKITPFLEGAAKYTYGRFTVDDMREAVLDGSYILWVAFDDTQFYGAVITNFAVYPRCRYLCTAFCGGIQLKKWKLPMLSLLRRFARDMACEGIESSGRPGWAKVFKDEGYKANWVTYTLPI